MNWAINIPFCDRGDLVLDAISAARQKLTEDEAQVVEVIATDALQRGITTVGGLLDELGGLDRAEARRRLDWAREEAGLVSATETNRRRENAAWERAWRRKQPPPPPQWSPLQRCPECGALPMKGSGAWAEVDCEQWWCPEHREGHEDDLKPHEHAYVGVNGTGQPIPSAKEKARIAAWYREREESEERERRRRQKHEEGVAKATEAAEERFKEEGEISIMGVRCRPDGRIIG